MIAVPLSADLASSFSHHPAVTVFVSRHVGIAIAHAARDDGVSFALLRPPPPRSAHPA